MAPARPPDASGSNIDTEVFNLSCEVVDEVVEVLEKNTSLILVIGFDCNVLEVLVFNPAEKMRAFCFFEKDDCPYKMAGKVKRIDVMTSK